MTNISDDMRDKIDAAAFRRLLSHLNAYKEVQNIDLMILAGFCRNCLSDWWREAAHHEGLDVTKNNARARVYGMAYADWKEKYQKPATPEQLAAMKQTKA